MMEEIWQQFISGLQNTTMLEYAAVFAGIASVWYSRKEDILVYPVGLINTIIYIYISIKGHLLGEASVNFYYTVMSIYGWVLWAKRNEQKQKVLAISSSTGTEWVIQLFFFTGVYAIIYAALSYLKQNFAPGAIPWADALASAAAFTGMWLMTRKKIESWYWWMLTNITSIPLYFVKHYVFTSVYYVILLIMAVYGWKEWTSRKGNHKDSTLLEY